MHKPQMPADRSHAVPRPAGIDEVLDGLGIGHRWVSREARSLPDDCVAKTLLLVEADRQAIALIPQGRRIDVEALNQVFQRRLRVAGISDVKRLFPDYPRTPLLPAWIDGRAEAFVEPALLELDTVALETCDPRRLLLIDGADFRRLCAHAWCARICAPF